MLPSGLQFFITLAPLLYFLVSAAPSRQCKAVPSSPSWPSQSTWSDLNSTLGGNLLTALPPAIVCDPTRAQYDTQQCTSVNEGWYLAIFHDGDPVSLQYPNWQSDACLPSIAYNGSNMCQLEPYPKYTVNASNSQHVIDGVRFAAKNNLRVSVKNTGHDFLGRSTSPEFSIWTHFLKGIEFHSSFVPKGCSKCPGFPAATIGAGNQFADVYKSCVERDVIIVGGAEPSVGLGGWLLGGGHSPLGAMYGLGVDNVVQMEVVTPAGELLTANEYENSDIFWAMRGGGGSTFGVLISATVKTHPNLHAANFTMTFSSTDAEALENNNKNFYSLLADLYAEIVDWSDNYVNGYYTFGPAAALDPSTKAKGMTLSFGGYMHNATVEQLQELMSEFATKMNNTKGVQGTLETSEVPKQTDLLGTSAGYAGAGYNILIGSRLWPKEVLTDKAKLLDFFRRVGVNPTQGLVVSGPGLRDYADADETSVSPAWRKTYLHTTSGVTFAFRNSNATAIARKTNTELTRALYDIAPDMGCYLNEANVHEPNARESFWGANYPRLLELKRTYDPNGMFWCLPCVGNEDWEMNKATGQLCKV